MTRPPGIYGRIYGQSAAWDFSRPADMLANSIGNPNDFQINVGRSQPNSEIAELDTNISKLDADIASHEPAPGNALDTANWAALNHKMNGFLLRWGQWKTALSNDWWWGDDDEQGLSALITEYNQIRADFISYVNGKTNSVPLDPTSPVLEEQDKQEAENGSPQQQLLDVVKTILYGAAALGAGYVILTAAGPAIARRLAKSG